MAGASVVCGATAGVLTNLVTGRWSWTLGVGLAVVVACWAALEVRRAIGGSEEPTAAVSVVQRAHTVAGRMIGVQNVQPSRRVQVGQRVANVEEQAEVVGFDGGSPGDQAS
jgi:hypothetical protein